MDKKINIAVLFGGKSTEHEVSVVSAHNVMENLDVQKYEIFPVYMEKDGTWYQWNQKNEEKTKLGNEMTFLKQMDVVFPVLHGLYGEDGTIQGMLELAGIPYVGCRVFSSSVCMDKAYAKVIFEKAGIVQTPYVYIKKKNDRIYYIDEKLEQKTITMQELIAIVENKLRFPLFVKPSNSGSSVGIHKVYTKKELPEIIKDAAKYDEKIIIEQGIVGKEVECAVLGNEEVNASTVGEILPAADFYTYDAKYNDENSQVLIPAHLSEEKIEEIRQLAIKAFQAVDGSGLARVDFFVEEGTQNVYLNEINTMPGFTNISMYPKLWKHSGLSYGELLDELICLAMKKE